MQETIKFLGTVDSRLRHHSYNSTPKHSNKINNKYPFAKVLDIQPKKMVKLPHWLTERDDFHKFIYQKYE